jgi:hypothetical protein
MKNYGYVGDVSDNMNHDALPPTRWSPPPGELGMPRDTPRMDATSPSLPGHAPLCLDDLDRCRLCHDDVARVHKPFGQGSPSIEI